MPIARVVQVLDRGRHRVQDLALPQIRGVIESLGQVFALEIVGDDDLVSIGQPTPRTGTGDRNARAIEGLERVPLAASRRPPNATFELLAKWVTPGRGVVDLDDHSIGGPPDSRSFREDDLMDATTRALV